MFLAGRTEADHYKSELQREYDEVERVLDRDHFMTATEAKEWGLIDHVYTSREAAALAF